MTSTSLSSNVKAKSCDIVVSPNPVLENSAQSLGDCGVLEGSVTLRTGTETVLPLALRDKRFSLTGLRGVARVDGVLEMPRSTCSLGLVETRGKKVDGVRMSGRYAENDGRDPLVELRFDDCFF